MRPVKCEMPTDFISTVYELIFLNAIKVEEE